MVINIDVTREELNEMQSDEWQLIDHVIDTLDGGIKELCGYQVNLKTVISKPDPADILYKPAKRTTN